MTEFPRPVSFVTGGTDGINMSSLGPSEGPTHLRSLQQNPFKWDSICPSRNNGLSVAAIDWNITGNKNILFDWLVCCWGW